MLARSDSMLSYTSLRCRSRPWIHGLEPPTALQLLLVKIASSFHARGVLLPPGIGLRLEITRNYEGKGLPHAEGQYILSSRQGGDLLHHCLVRHFA